MKLKEALDVRPGEVISLVGGGGKTTLMFALARELSAEGRLVITTTTTKIREPSAAETPLLLLEDDEVKLLQMLRQNAPKYRHITLARRRLPSGKLNGISPGLVMGLAELEPVSYIIVEADGAARKPLKAPNATEPVIPDNTSLVIAMVGVEAIGTHLNEANVFRPEIVSSLLGMEPGAVITARDIARLITYPQGIAKGSPPEARIVPFINKVDLPGGLAKGRELAREILAMRHPRIERVVLGQTQLPDPVAGVVYKKED